MVDIGLIDTQEVELVWISIGSSVTADVAPGLLPGVRCAAHPGSKAGGLIVSLGR